MVCLMLGMTISCKDKKPEVLTDSLSGDTAAVNDTVDTVAIDTVPEDAMDSVRSAVSRSSMPFKRMAISSAAS